MWFFLLYDHVNIDVNVNININACRLWGTGYGFLIVCGIPMFVALWLAHKCTSPRTNIVWLNLSWYMYMIYFRNTVRYTTQENLLLLLSYFCTLTDECVPFEWRGVHVWNRNCSLKHPLIFQKLPKSSVWYCHKGHGENVRIVKIKFIDRQTDRWTMNTQIHIYINKGNF